VIGVAVIGAGHWGPNLVRNFQSSPRTEVLWVVDRDERRLEQLRDRYPDVKLATDPTEALRSSDVDAVVVATPTTTHFSVVRAALEHDKHVMVEKPLTSNAVEAARLVDLAGERRRVLLVGHVFVYNPAVVRAKQYLDEGAVGAVHYISMTRTNLGPIRFDVNAAWDLASHDIAIANYWLGTSPLAASAVGGMWINPGIEDAVFASLRYPGGVLVHLHSSWLNPRKLRDITVVGERSMLTVDDMNVTEPLRIYDKGVRDEPSIAEVADTFMSFRASVREGSVTIPRVPLGEPLRAECDHFVECVMTGARPMTGGPEGLAVVRALEAVDRSVRGGGREEPVEQPA
jgi:predicted dehydrogenase